MRAAARSVASGQLAVGEQRRRTAHELLIWDVDWLNFRDEYPWVDGNGDTWKARLADALRPAFAAEPSPHEPSPPEPSPPGPSPPGPPKGSARWRFLLRRPGA